MSGARLWHDLTTTDFAAVDPARWVAELPVAAIEQHGPHLPLVVDAAINHGILARAMEQVPEDCPVLVLPALPIGTSGEHADFPGTLSLGAETMIRLITEVCESVARAGLRKLILFNSHGGQPRILDIVAQDLRTRRSMIVLAVNSWRLMRPDGLFPARELREGVHAGAIETSLMLHLRPELVRRSAVRDFASAARGIEDYPGLAVDGRWAFAWQAQDLHPEGAVGDASLASADAGRVLSEQAAAGLLGLIREMSRLPLDAVRERP